MLGNLEHERVDDFGVLKDIFVAQWPAQTCDENINRSTAIATILDKWRAAERSTREELSSQGDASGNLVRSARSRLDFINAAIDGLLWFGVTIENPDAVGASSLVMLPNPLLASLFYLNYCFEQKASRNVKNDWIRVIECLVVHGCQVDRFFHSRNFPNNLGKRLNQRWLDWSVFHFIQNYFSKQSNQYVPELEAILMESCSKGDASRYLPNMVEVVWCQGTGENLWREFESSFIYNPAIDDASDDEENELDELDEADDDMKQQPPQPRDMRMNQQRCVFRNFRMFGGYFSGLPTKQVLIKYLECGIVPFGITNITTFDDENIAPRKQKFLTIEELCQFTKQQFGPKCKFKDFPVVDNIRLCKRQSLAPIILYAMYVAGSEMRANRLQVLKRCDKISSKHCGNEWLGDEFWGIVLDHLYGNILDFPCLPWKFESLFHLKFETFCSLRFSDMKGMLVKHFSKPIEHYLYVKQLLSDLKFIQKIYQTHRSQTEFKETHAQSQKKKKTSTKTESKSKNKAKIKNKNKNEANPKTKENKDVRVVPKMKFQRKSIKSKFKEFTYIDIIHAKIDLMLNAKFWELGLIFVKNIIEAQRRLNSSSHVYTPSGSTDTAAAAASAAASEMKEDVVEVFVDTKMFCNEFPKCVRDVTNASALKLAILLLTHVKKADFKRNSVETGSESKTSDADDEKDAKSSRSKLVDINTLEMTKYETKLVKRKNLVLILINSIVHEISNEQAVGSKESSGNKKKGLKMSDEKYQRLVGKLISLLKDLGYNFESNENSNALLYCASKNCVWLMKLLIECGGCQVNRLEKFSTASIDDVNFNKNHYYCVMAVACFSALDEKCGPSFEMLDYLLTLKNVNIGTMMDVGDEKLNIFQVLLQNAPTYEKALRKCEGSKRECMQSALVKVFNKLLEYCKQFELDTSFIDVESLDTRRYTAVMECFES